MISPAKAGAGSGVQDCRSCASPLGAVVLDLGNQPIVEFDDSAGPSEAIVRRPLRLHCCPTCGLVQLGREGAEPPSVAHGHGASFSTTVSAHVAARIVGLIQAVPPENLAIGKVGPRASTGAGTSRSSTESLSTLTSAKSHVER